MKHKRSKDGTPIAFEAAGHGPPLILVLGAFNDRRAGAPLSAALAQSFCVFNYDRRGRGGSGDAPTYAVEREVEDIDAMIQVAGGSASLFGYSSGAALALEAAARGLPVARLALYEMPPSQPPEHAVRLAELIQAGRRGDAVEYFQRRMVGIPEEVVAKLRDAPFRPALEAMAHTLVYEATVLAEARHTSERLANVRLPMLVIAGSASPPVLRDVSASLARASRHATLITLEGAGHDLVPDLLAPILKRWSARPDTET